MRYFVLEEIFPFLTILMTTSLQLKLKLILDPEVPLDMKEEVVYEVCSL